MKASEVLRQYKTGERDFQGVNLRGQSFKGQDLSGADFSEADIRSTNFTDATLIGANFSGAKCGLQRRWARLWVILSWLLAGISGYFSILPASFISMIFHLSSRQELIAGWISLILLVVFLFTSYIRGIRCALVAVVVALVVVVAVVVIVPGLTQVASPFLVPGIGLLAGPLLGTVAVAILETVAAKITVAIVGIGAVIGAFASLVIGQLTGRFPVLETDAFVIAPTGAITVVVVSLLLARRALKGYKRDAWVRSFAVAFAAMGGTSFRSANLTKANFGVAKVKSTDFRKANLTLVRWYKTEMLDRVRPGDTYLKNAQVRQWLVGKGTENNFDHQDLRGVDLQGANLKNASFIGTDLGEANLSEATLTGACIEDWVINNQTNLDNVICKYVYLKKDLKERLPHDDKKEFEGDQFTKYIEKALNTVDLIFTDGIDWKAFFASFQALQDEYGAENVGVQAIEKKSGGAFVVRIEVPPDANKAKIETQVKESYEAEVKVLEAQYRGQLQAKDEQIAIYRQHNTDLLDIIRQKAAQPIKENHFHGSVGSVDNKGIQAGIAGEVKGDQSN